MDIFGFNPLWINTALKLCVKVALKMIVSIPYGLTLLSNSKQAHQFIGEVSIPYGLTLLSNAYGARYSLSSVSIPYGLTLLSNSRIRSKMRNGFQSPMD